jgi:hypothetical protein
MEKLKCPNCGKVELEYVGTVVAKTNSCNEEELNPETEDQRELYECSYCKDRYIKEVEASEQVTFGLVMPNLQTEEEKEEWLEQHYI